MRKRLLAAGLVFALLLGGSAAAAPLLVGSISSRPDAEIAKFQPFVEYLATELKGSGIDLVRTIVAKDIPAMAEMMASQQVDIYLDSTYPTLAVSRLSGSKIMLRRWKSGKAEYRSLIVVPTDSPFRSLADLKGKLVAVEDPYSTLGYFLPKGALLDAKLKLREFSDIRSSVSPDEVGLVFSRGNETTLLWVLRGKTAAGAVGEHDLTDFLKAQPAALRVLHQTEYVPRHLVSYRKTLDPALADRLREVLIGMEHTDAGRKALQAFERTTRFDDPPGGMQKALAPLLRMGKDMDRELGLR